MVIRNTVYTVIKAIIHNFLEDNNIQTRVTFAGNVTRHPVYREYLQSFKNADTIMKNSFLLGAHHGMTIEDVDYVCDKVKEFFSK
jgi:CDP-4-dehydro-6-deoxyglucose reductase, E1